MKALNDTKFPPLAYAPRVGDNSLLALAQNWAHKKGSRFDTLYDCFEAYRRRPLEDREQVKRELVVGKRVVREEHLQVLNVQRLERIKAMRGQHA